MDERVLEILKLCLELKEKGIDCFFGYSPHVQAFSLKVHMNGWDSGNEPELDLVQCYIDKSEDVYRADEVDMALNFLKNAKES